MKKIPWRAVAALLPVVIIAVVCAVILSGCAFGKRRAAVIPAPVSAPIVAGQKGKDATILAEAAAIDQVSPEAKPHTDAQRAAVAAAPAEDVAKLVRDLESQNSALIRDNAEKDKRINDMKNAEQAKEVATLRCIGLGALVVAGLLAWAQKVRFAAVSGLVCLVSLGLAQLISQPWFMPAVGIASGVALIALGWAAWHDYQKGTLAKKVAEESERMQAALKTIVPAVDEAIESLDEATQTVVKDALSKSMDADHKKLIHQIRATL